MNRFTYESEKLNAVEIISRMIALLVIFYGITSLVLMLIAYKSFGISLLLDSNLLSFGDGYIVLLAFVISSFPWYVK